MLILDEVLGARLIGASPSLGTAWALHATSTGKAILAASSEERLARLLSDPLERFTPGTVTDRTELDRILEDVRAKGYATVSEELEEGYAAAAAVIRTPMLDPYAALCLGGPSARLRLEILAELGALLRSRAEEISARLGYEG